METPPLITPVAPFVKYIQSSKSFFERVFDLIFLTLDIYKSLSKAKTASLTSSPSVKRKVVQPAISTFIALDNKYDGGDTSEKEVISEKELKESLPQITDFFDIRR